MLGAIDLWHGEEGCTAGAARLAEASGLHLRAGRYSLARLARLGYIKIIASKGRVPSSIFLVWATVQPNAPLTVQCIAPLTVQSSDSQPCSPAPPTVQSGVVPPHTPPLDRKRGSNAVGNAEGIRSTPPGGARSAEEPGEGLAPLGPPTSARGEQNPPNGHRGSLSERWELTRRLAKEAGLSQCDRLYTAAGGGDRVVYQLLDQFTLLPEEAQQRALAMHTGQIERLKREGKQDYIPRRSKAVLEHLLSLAEGAGDGGVAVGLFTPEEAAAIRAEAERERAAMRARA